MVFILFYELLNGVLESCMILLSFVSRKNFKAYYGFRVLYVFPFPSAGHWPLGSGRDKVGIRAMDFIADLWIIVLCFLTLLRY